jgi:lysozyme family protein
MTVMTGDNRFNYCIPIILKEEGGYVNDPNDPGGETNMGISKAAYPNLDIKNLTVDQVTEIYYTDYWIPSGCKSILTPPLDLFLFNFAVTSGVKEAIEMAQQLVGAGQDGVLGPQTQGMLMAFKGDTAVFQALCAMHYAANKNFSYYGKGWLSRLFRISANP